MKKAFCLVGILLWLLISGCAFMRTPNFVSHDNAVKYTPTNSIKLFWSVPKETYREIGLVYVEWGAPGLEYKTIEQKALLALQEKGMAVGAHGLILRPIERPAGCLSPSYLFRWEAIAIRFD